MGPSAINIYTFTLPDIVTKTQCYNVDNKFWYFKNPWEKRYQSCTFCDETCCLRLCQPFSKVEENCGDEDEDVDAASQQHFPTLHCWLPLNVIDGEAIWEPPPSPSFTPGINLRKWSRLFARRNNDGPGSNYPTSWSPNFLISREGRRSFLDQLREAM